MSLSSGLQSLAFTHLIVIRHGETAWNRERRLQGQLDIPLNETGRAQASWMGSTFSAPLKKKGYSLLVDLSRAPIPYVGTSLVVRKNAAHQDAKTYEALLKGTIDALRFFQKPENKPAVMRTMARHLRLNRVEDAENGYQAMIAAYSSDFRPKPEGLQKIYAILARSNPKLTSLKPESILDSSFIQRIQSTGY